MLATVTKPSIRPVFGFRTEKNFWCSLMQVCSTSGGRPRNASPIRPIRGTGHSTSPATSARRPGVRDHFHPGGEGQVLRALPDRGLTLGGVQDDIGALQFDDIVVEAR